MSTAEITWTIPGRDNADLFVTFDPTTADANGNVVVSSASGTYQALDANNNVIRTDQVTGLIAPNSFVLAPDDELNINGTKSLVDLNGLGVIINNAADADQVGPNSTPEVVLSTDIFGDYRELQKGNVQKLTANLVGSSSGGSGGGSTGGDSSGVTSTVGPNGRTVVDIEAPDQTVGSSESDVFKNHGAAGTTFVFTPGYGHDVIGGFSLDNPDHDTLSLPSSDFTSLAQVIQQTQAAPSGAVIHDTASGDTIRLYGVTKADFASHLNQDVTFNG